MTSVVLCHISQELSAGCKDVAPPPPNCRSPVPLVALNCSGNPGCMLDGLTIIGSSGYEGDPMDTNGHEIIILFRGLCASMIESTANDYM